MTFLEDNKLIFERPVKVQLDITNKCNLNCLYCYNKSNYFSSKDDLADKDLFLIAKKIIKELKPIVLSLSGGEPLLKKELTYKILTYASKKNTEIWLTSNLLLLDKNTAKKLKKLGLKKIFTNIDNVNPKIHDRLRGKKGAFNTAIKNLKQAKKIFDHDNITITSVITKHNYKDIDLTIDFLHKHGLSKLKLLDMIPINNQSMKDVLNQKQWQEFYKIYKKSNIKAKTSGITITPCHALLFMGQKYLKMKLPFCMAGRLNLVILATGEILPCNHLKFKEFGCGNALNDSLLEVWQQSPILNRFRYDLDSYHACT
ncbi:radical SAM protein, partial [Patescibacteria group bacterium]|nr:radical SAM protein [Patescibacteria group bacterium]